MSLCAAAAASRLLQRLRSETRNTCFISAWKEGESLSLSGWSKVIHASLSSRNMKLLATDIYAFILSSLGEAIKPFCWCWDEVHSGVYLQRDGMHAQFADICYVQLNSRMDGGTLKVQVSSRGHQSDLRFRDGSWGLLSPDLPPTQSAGTKWMEGRWGGGGCWKS